MTDDSARNADHPAMTDHWWWRPGWRVGTRFYAWHITQDDQPEVRDLAQRYRAAVSTIETLDPIPDEWLHMTMQGLGHVEDINIAALDFVTLRVAERLRTLAPITTSYQRAEITSEAVILTPDDPEAFAEARRAIRAGITDALGECPESEDGFRAHVSVAYGNADADAAPIRAALDRAEPVAPSTATYTKVSLIRMHRDQRMYEWDVIRAVPLGE
jgi:2'-5' RNA ligase